MPGQFLKPASQRALSLQRKERHRLFVLGRPGQRLIHRPALQDVGLPLVQHLKAGINRGLGRVGAQNLGTETVDGTDAGGVQFAVKTLPAGPLWRREFGPPQITAHLVTHPIAHLAGRLFGKGDGNDRSQRQPLGQQGEVAGHQRAGLAGAGPGGDHDVPPPGQDGRHLLITGVHLADNEMRLGQGDNLG